MKKNSILNKRFKLLEECLCIWFCRKSFIKKLLDIAKQKRTAFLLGKGYGSAPVGVWAITDQNAFVKFSRMPDDNRGAMTLISMEKGGERISEKPEPVTLPADFNDVDERRIRQGFFQSIIERFSLPVNKVIESNQCPGCQSQFAETFQDVLGIVAVTFDFVPEKRSLSYGIRSDKSIGNFVFAPTMNNVFAVGTSVVAMDKAGCCKFTVLKVFLDMLSSMVAMRISRLFTKQTAIKISINGSDNDLRFQQEMAFVSNRIIALDGTFRRVFFIIFCTRALKRIGQFFFEMSILVHKFLDPLLKFLPLIISEVHNEFMHINPRAATLAFRKDTFRLLVLNKHAEFMERTIWMSYSVPVKISFLLPTCGAFPNINIIKVLRHSETHPTLNITEYSR